MVTNRGILESRLEKGTAASRGVAGLRVVKNQLVAAPPLHRRIAVSLPKGSVGIGHGAVLPHENPCVGQSVQKGLPFAFNHFTILCHKN